jgi:hypothetical protein
MVEWKMLHQLVEHRPYVAHCTVRMQVNMQLNGKESESNKELASRQVATMY